MQILKALRNRFEGLSARRPGCESMLEALRSRGGYRPFGPGESGQSDPHLTGCSFADTVLVPAIGRHGPLDQECVTQMTRRCP